MFERYNQQARRALFFARYEASKIGDRIEAEHLLLALLREGRGISQLLVRCHVSPQRSDRR